MTAELYKILVSEFPEPFRKVIQNNVSYSLDPEMAAIKTYCVVELVAKILKYIATNNIQFSFDEMAIYWSDGAMNIDFPKYKYSN